MFDVTVYWYKVLLGIRKYFRGRINLGWKKPLYGGLYCFGATVANGVIKQTKCERQIVNCLSVIMSAITVVCSFFMVVCRPPRYHILLCKTNRLNSFFNSKLLYVDDFISMCQVFVAILVSHFSIVSLFRFLCKVLTNSVLDLRF